MELLDGKGLSAKIKDDIKNEMDAYIQTPILAVEKMMPVKYMLKIKRMLVNILV